MFNKKAGKLEFNSLNLFFIWNTCET